MTRSYKFSCNLRHNNNTTFDTVLHDKLQDKTVFKLFISIAYWKLNLSATPCIISSIVNCT